VTYNCVIVTCDVMLTLTLGLKIRNKIEKKIKNEKNKLSPRFIILTCSQRAFSKVRYLAINY